MGLQKGQTNNPNGRPKGSKSRRTEQWEKFSEWFMCDGMDRLQEEMSKLKGKEFIREVKDLMEFFQPKLQRTETDITTKGESVNKPIIEFSQEDKDKQ